MEHFHRLAVMVKAVRDSTTIKPSRTMVARGGHMAWTTPTLVEICIGLEINGYLPAEF
jgi:coenzyme PQQ precursor peptide PqqA